MTYHLMRQLIARYTFLWRTRMPPSNIDFLKDYTSRNLILIRLVDCALYNLRSCTTRSTTNMQ
jgi:hypothetical protein